MTTDWVQFWDGKAGSATDFQATGRGTMDVVGYLYTVSEVVRILRPVPDSRLLDIGCGTGLMCLSIAPWVARVHGIDISPEMVARAGRNVADLASVSVAVGSICATGEADASYDRVLAYSVVQYLAGAAEVVVALREVARVLKPGGRALLAANPDPDRRDALIEIIRGRNAPDVAERDIALMNSALWLSPDTLVQLAESVGLEARAEPINPRIWQHFYMFDLVLTKRA